MEITNETGKLVNVTQEFVTPTNAGLIQYQKIFPRVSKRSQSVLTPFKTLIILFKMGLRSATKAKILYDAAKRFFEVPVNIS